MNANNIDSAPSKHEANSSIFDEKSGLCSCEREDRTNGSLTKRATNLPDLSQKDAKFAKIGIVIPIYNVAPYLRECLDSVLNQTYKNFHAVLVNDGSTDNSKEIALEYVAKDSRFTLIDKENGGLSSARNAGIKYFNESAKNSPQIDYIIFLDSDDFWDENLLQTCADSAKAQNLDIIWFGWKTFYENTNRGGGSEDRKNHSIKNQAPAQREYKNEFTWVGHYKYDRQALISGVDVLNRARERGIALLANAWDIFIDWRYLQRIRLDFLEGVIWEDVLFAELLFAQSERILALPKALSNYRVRVDSTQNFANFKQKNLPPFVKPLEKYFSDTNAAWAYFSAYSWVCIAREFVRFCESYKDTKIAKMLQDCYLAHLLVEASVIMECESDPNGAKDEFLSLAKKWGRKYLPPSKKRFVYYESSLAWRFYQVCSYLSKKKQKFRKWRKGLLAKQQ